MRQLVLAFLLLAASLHLARGQDRDATSPRLTGAAPDSEEGEFHDPFAQEEPQNKPAVPDPLESMNRAFFKFNDRLYFWILKPVARGYTNVAPEPMRSSVKLFFVNARYPVRAVNNLLQGKFKGLGVETTRFLINSTIGIAGLFDPAQNEWHLRPYPEDLDQTLGFYHVPMGWYLNWPLFGPSSIRGTAGMIGDGFLSPWPYIDGLEVLIGTRVLDTVNSTSLQLGEYESLKRAAFDPYVALRDAYVSNRRSLIDR